MAYKVPLKTFGRKPADMKADYEAKMQAKEMTAQEVQTAVTAELKDNPYFDYRDVIAQILPSPIQGGARGNSGTDVRSINRIMAKLDADKTADNFLIEEAADYRFLASRIDAYTGWTGDSPAVNRLIEQFLDDIAKAEKVEVVEKPKEEPAKRRAPRRNPIPA